MLNISPRSIPIDTWIEFTAEDELLREWAYWVRSEPYCRGDSVSFFRAPSPRREPWADDLIMPVDRAVACLLPIYKNAIKRWYLGEIHDCEHVMRSALGEFRAAFDAQHITG